MLRVRTAPRFHLSERIVLLWTRFGRFLNAQAASWFLHTTGFYPTLCPALRMGLLLGTSPPHRYGLCLRFHPFKQGARMVLATVLLQLGTPALT